MKKVLSVLLAGALAMSTLAGCGSTQSSTPSSGGSAQSTGGDNAEKTTLVLWTRDRADASFIQPWIDKYNETNKDGIFIDYKCTPTTLSRLWIWPTPPTAAPTWWAFPA